MEALSQACRCFLFQSAEESVSQPFVFKTIVLLLKPKQVYKLKETHRTCRIKLTWLLCCQFLMAYILWNIRQALKYIGSCANYPLTTRKLNSHQCCTSPSSLQSLQLLRSRSTIRQSAVGITYQCTFPSSPPLPLNSTDPRQPCCKCNTVIMTTQRALLPTQALTRRWVPYNTAVQCYQHGDYRVGIRRTYHVSSPPSK